MNISNLVHLRVLVAQVAHLVQPVRQVPPAPVVRQILAIQQVQTVPIVQQALKVPVAQFIIAGVAAVAQAMR